MDRAARRSPAGARAGRTGGHHLGRHDYPLKTVAEFVTSAAEARDLPQDNLPQIALVGRSNVGKSSLINALVRQRVARTSAAPGKTRLANVYRVQRSSPFYLVDLPGYGFARALRHAQGERETEFRGLATDVVQQVDAALLLVDARHPGLANDVSAWAWLTDTVATRGLVATKMDKLSRAERLRAMHEIEAVFDHPVTAVSATTGEGLDELWKLIDRLNSRNPPPHRSPPPPNPTAAVDRPRHRRQKNSSSRR
ncbi:MAG TPA: ribosome biogenesis GTP-binding protein YihA/YsxC [Vicinamibacterales bacterium]|nr:ribosome biogenesis GTP-binding protein YihA/YsxC [Vicinamibacterales bacterium]